MKNFLKVVVVVAEWAVLATAITFGCAIGGEAASAAVDHIKKKKERKEVTPETVSATEL